MNITFMLFLMQLSLLFPMIALEAPLLICMIIPIFIFSPLIFQSLKLSQIVSYTFYLLRPILYIIALIVTICGKQDFFAIFFYVVTALQAVEMLKNFIGTLFILINICSSKENSKEHQTDSKEKNDSEENNSQDQATITEEFFNFINSLIYKTSDTALSNFKKIDDSIQYEEALRQSLKTSCEKNLKSAKDELLIYFMKVLIIFLVFLLIDILIVYFVIPGKYVFWTVVLSLFLSVTISAAFIYNRIFNHFKYTSKYKQEQSIETENKIFKNYATLLHNVDVRQLLAIPNNIYFDENKNLYYIANNEDLNHIESIQINKESPLWYEYYFKVKEIAEKNNIPFVDASYSGIDCNVKIVFTKTKNEKINQEKYNITLKDKSKKKSKQSNKKIKSEEKTFQCQDTFHKDFDDWFEVMAEEDMPKNEATDLTIEAFKLCFEDKQIFSEYNQDMLFPNDIIPNLAENKFAVFDYGMFSYFMFRAYLCTLFSHKYVELFDSNFHYIMSIYFKHYYDIELDKTFKLIKSRSEQFDKTVISNRESENIENQLIDLFIDLIKKDFNNTPFSYSIVLWRITKEFKLKTVLTHCLKITTNKLKNACEKYIH